MLNYNLKYTKNFNQIFLKIKIVLLIIEIFKDF